MLTTRKTATLAAIAAASAATAVATAPAAQALSLTRVINGTSYDITTIQGPYDILGGAVIPQQDLLGDSMLAESLATAVGDALGSPNSGPNSIATGPYFAFSDLGPFVQFWNVRASAPADAFLNVLPATDFSEQVTWGVVTSSTPIPTPALLPGLLGMGIATLRQREANLTKSSDA